MLHLFPTRRLLLATLLAIAALASIAPVAYAADPIVMKLAHVVNPGSPRDRLLRLYGENLDKRTGGRIKVQVYPSAQLGDNRQIIEGIQNGTIEGTISPTAFMGSFSPLLTVLDLPMLFTSVEQASRTANGEVGADLMRESETKGLHGLAFYGEGEKNLATNFPVSGLADLKGKRLRVIPTPVLLQQVRDWGANPVPVEFSETYGALQSGAVVGQEQQWGLIHDLKYFEVSKYLTETRHGMLTEYFFVSKRWFDKLPADLQVAITAEAKALIPMRLEWAQSYTKESVEKLKAAKGVQFTVMPEAQRAEFVKAAQPTYDAFIKTNGKVAADLIDKIRKQNSAGR